MNDIRIMKLFKPPNLEIENYCPTCLGCDLPK